MLSVLIVIIVITLIAITFAFYGSRVKNGLDSRSMYNVASCLVVASIISGAISLAAIYISLNSDHIDYTHQDVLVDILGVLVTVLMGWNIISVVDFKKRAEKVDSISEDIEHVISGIMRLNINSFMMIGEKHVLLDNCMISLKEIKECKNDQVNRMAIDEVMNLINLICQEMNSEGKLVIYKDKKPSYLHLLRHVDHEFADDIIKLIANAEYTEEQKKQRLNTYKPEYNNEISFKVEGDTLYVSDYKK